VTLHPGSEFLPTYTTGGDTENERLLLVDRRRHLEAVQNKHDFHCGMTDPLVAIDEG
jgi:hypothetical protein